VGEWGTCCTEMFGGALLYAMAYAASMASTGAVAQHEAAQGAEFGRTSQPEDTALTPAQSPSTRLRTQQEKGNPSQKPASGGCPEIKWGTQHRTGGCVVTRGKWVQGEVGSG